MRPLPFVLGAAALLAVSAAAPAAADDSSSPSPFTIQDPRITESSGLAASRLHPGVYWTHNDSSDGPYVYAVDSRTGKTVARVTLRGIGDPRDVEAISIGPDGNVYVGDIGDNLGGQWSHVWIYRFPEPKRLTDTTVTATQFTVKYQGGPRNAEALMVHPKTGRVYIASKSDEDAGLYAGPTTLSPSGVNVFQRVSDLDMEVTDGAFSPDGTRLVLRGYFSAAEYRWRNGRPARLEEEPGLPLQRQGESVTFTPDGGTLMYGTEGAGSKVTPVDLGGELLPDATAKEQKKNGEYSDRVDGKLTDDDKNGNLVKAGLTFVGALVVFFGLRRLFRRS
ncbi:hypothetical protein VT50_0201165 [Streptomyces antioxidans]|uniref:WD40 repeat domain-containing protein n=1 Tax=Streptomyces antioxidans TaxID=1507734 RepID=A0A1V4DD79_9ACTN|nr:membrane protein [Streptomyces antioxidans]OPF84667.1 hypothetical protein VT50_0201165 [Streptomyces antioxidans]